MQLIDMSMDSLHKDSKTCVCVKKKKAVFLVGTGQMSSQGQKLSDLPRAIKTRIPLTVRCKE